MNYQVLLYYHYTTIEDPAAFSEEHLAACKEIGLKGRILVAHEGINGTVSGTIEQTQNYIDMMEAHPLFKGIVFKIDPAGRPCVQKNACTSTPGACKLRSGRRCESA